MGLTVQKQEHITLEEFFNWDDGTDTHYELIRGKIIAMTPPLGLHNLTIMEIGRAFNNRIPSPCKAYPNSGVVIDQADNTYYEPDLVVSCEKLTWEDRNIPNPIVIVEVLSHSTQDFDRIQKLMDYQSLSTVQDILIVLAQEKKIQHWRRQEDVWIVTNLSINQSLKIASLRVEIPLSEIF